MINNDQLTQFIQEIDKFNSEKVWKNDHLGQKMVTYLWSGLAWAGITAETPKKEELSIQKVNFFITENMHHLEQCINDTHNRRKLSTLALRLESHFPATASHIGFHVNSVLFNVSDIVKHIFTYLTPNSYWSYSESRLKKPLLTLNTQCFVTKNFCVQASVVMKDFVQKHFISPTVYGITTADQLVQCVKKHNLTIINLEKFRDFNEQHLKILSETQKITKLMICCSEIKEFPKIESLINLRPLDVTNDKLLAISKAFPKLQILDISRYGRECIITEREFEEIIKNCLELQDINLHSTKMTFENLPEFTASNLKRLDLQYSSVTDQGLIKLANGCKNLEVLHLSGSQNITDAGIEEFSKICSKLKYIDLISTPVTGKSFEILLKNCPDLETVLFYGPLISDENIQACTIKHTNLKMIHLSRTLITDEGCINLIKILPNLEHLSLPGTIITGKFLLELGACKKLHKINLQETKRLNDEALEGLENIRLELRDINLYETAITGKGLEKIAIACPYLEKIHLGDYYITADDLIMLAKTCPNLQEIICEWSIITIEVREAIKQINPHLNLVS